MLGIKGLARAAALAGLAALALIACGAPAAPLPAADANNAGTAAGPEVNNGEAPALTYTDARYGYRIDAPGRMTANGDGTASFVGPSERLLVAVVQGPRAADLVTLARDDAASLPSSTPGFRLQAGPRAISLTGRQVEKFIYTWNAGTNQVTGKPLSLVGVRYYVPKDSATVAVITYGIVSNQYDPQGADDIASTFQWR